MARPRVRYERDGRVARVVLDRPDRLNAIDEAMPGELERAVGRANDDPEVRVIVLSGAGRAFCAGYDLEVYAERPGPNPFVQQMPWDPTLDLRAMSANNRAFMSLWRSPKPVVCKVHGHAVAGGSDIALCADLVIMGDEARIGYPPARVWGCPTTAMWVYRVGAERAKRLLLTGDLITGREAARIGLVAESVPGGDLDAAVDELAGRIARVPVNQLVLHKLMINQVYENMGLATTQMIATLFDGIARHTPEGVAFKARAEAAGFKAAVRERDGGDPD